MTQFGCNCGPSGALDMWTTIRDAVGPFTGWRAFNPGNIPPAYPGFGSGHPPPGADWPLMSCKPDPVQLAAGQLDTQIQAYVAGAQPGAFITFWHEDENDMPPAVSKAMHAHAYTVVKKARPDCFYGQIVMAYTASPLSKYYPLSQYIATRPNGHRLDFYGIDGYRRNTSMTVASTFEAARRQIHSVVPKGVVTVTECNSLPDGRAQWFRDVAAWADANACPTFFPFFFPEGYLGAGPYNWDPADTETISVLQGIYQASVA